MEEDYQHFWRRYFSVSSPKPITEINPSISDAGNAFVYQSIFKDLSDYPIFFKNKNNHYILSEQNNFFDDNGTIYITGHSHFVNNHFYSFNNSNNRFIYCNNVNSTVTEGSISYCINSDSGSLCQHNEQINIKAVNFSKCKTRWGSAISCLWVQKVVNVSCCCIDSCHASSFAAVYFESLNATLIKSNIINNTHIGSSWGIIYLSGFSYHKLSIEDCIFQKNCQNKKGPYFSTNSYANIYIFHTISDKTTAYHAEGTIYMSEMTTTSFQNDFFICLTSKMLIKSIKQNTDIGFDLFSYVHLFYQIIFSIE